MHQSSAYTQLSRDFVEHFRFFGLEIGRFDTELSGLGFDER